MAADVQNMTEDLTGSMWRDDEWLRFYPLNAHTALDYFSLSPFYEHDCSNEKAKLQGLQPSQLQQLMPGTEFVLQEAQEPHLFVIRRQYRSAPATIVTHAVYYILEGGVYQAPTLHAAVSARLARCMHSMRTAFSRMQDDLDPVIVGVRLAQKAEERQKADAAAAVAEAAAAAQRHQSKEEQERGERVDGIIRSVLRQHGGVPVLAVPAASAGLPSTSVMPPAPTPAPSG